MIRLTYSNRTEALLAALARRIAAARADPLAPTWIVTPNRNVERYVELGIARTLGVAANLRFVRLSALARQAAPETGHELLLGDALGARVLFALTDQAFLDHADAGPVRRYLFAHTQDPDAVDRRRAQLALHLTHLFEEYGFSRADLLCAWARGERLFEDDPSAHDEEAWQATLFAHVRAYGGPDPGVSLREAVLGASSATDAHGSRGEVSNDPGAAVETLHVFGLSYVARVFAEVFEQLARTHTLHLYALNPCEEYWEDLETDRERRRRERRGAPALEGAMPGGLFDATDPPLLSRLGRPGREYVRLLGVLTDGAFEAAFEEPGAAAGALPLFARAAPATLLLRIQRDILHRTVPTDARAEAADASLRVLACPSVRREVESVVARIRALAEQHDDLSFDQIAVLVNGPDGERYLPHLESVFEEAGPIPHSIVDLPLAAASPVAEAALRLLSLPVGPLGRPELLSVLTHPRVGHLEQDPEAIVALVERLGIFRGLDRESHRGTYVEGEDRLSWDQGVRRVALGAYLDPGFVELDGRRYLPEVDPFFQADDAALAQLIRALAGDVRFARSTRASMSDWVSFMTALLDAYVRPRSAEDDAALARVRGAIQELVTYDRGGPEVRYALAHELAVARLGALTTGRRGALGEGVVIASLLPMRAIPFRVIFALGLGEGRFPASDRADAMDLRAARRWPGDVTPSERDRYTFLETLLSAREHLYLSYVARDESTGDPLAPSVVVTELLETIEESYLDDRERLVERPPLHRHHDDAVVRVLPSAARERRARALGERFFAAPDAPERGDPEGLRAATSSDPALREALGWIELPEAPSEPLASDPGQRTTVSTSALRRFLESPLQGFARAVLRLTDADLASVEATADEPFTASALTASVVLQRSFRAHALFATPLEEAYRAEVEPLAARGRWPLGAFATLERARHHETLTRWTEGLRAVAPAGALSRLRFGPGARHEPVTEVHDPVELGELDLPRGPARTVLGGTTELLDRDARTTVVAIPRHKGGALGRYDELRYALRGFLDHALLSLNDDDGRAHRVVQLYGDGHAAVVHRLAPLGAEAARAWLRAVAEDLLGEPHDYVFPIEAVARLRERGDEVDGRALVASIEAIRERYRGGQSRFGPVRDPERYPTPDEAGALRRFERRFGPLFDALREAG